jgi:PAS domain S-box-containing protein
MAAPRPLADRAAWHQRVDGRVALGVTLIVTFALLAVLGATGRVITATSIERSAADLEGARNAFDQIVAIRTASAAAEARLVLATPAFRAMMETDPDVPINGVTLNQLTDEYCRKLRATFCVVTDADGAWTARGGDTSVESPGTTTALAGPIAVAREGRSANRIVATAAGMLLVVSEPAMFGEVEVVGTLTAAYRLDNATARDLAVITHCDVSFLCGTRVCGTSLGVGAEAALAAMLSNGSAGPPALGAPGASPARRKIGDMTFVGGVYPLKAASPDATLALLQDWSPARHAINQLYLVLFGIGGVVLAIALVGGFAFSRRLTRPLRDLAGAAGEIAGGQWGRSVKIEGPVETRTMGEAFNHMASSIAHWHEQAESRARRLGETYERFRSVSDSVHDAIISADTDGRVLFWNRHAEVVFGHAEADALGQPLTMLVPERHLAAFTAALDRLREEPGASADTIEISGLRRDGTEFPIELSLSTWKAGAALCSTAVIRDITERRHAAEALRQREDELRQANKMEAVGRLAGGVAHDFNNLLTAILGYADLLLDKLPGDDPNRRQIVEIQKAGRSAASLTRGLLAFSRKQVLQPIVLNLNTVVSNSENLLRRLIGEDVELVIALEPTLAATTADPAQIEQLLVNLAVNARDAMPAGGRLTIATVNLDEATTRVHAPAAAGGSVAVVVRDTGVGMTEAVRAHIFEPFFTTKGPGHGTGLGLASVYGAVKQSGGHVWVDSTPGQGSTFTVCLPAVAAAAVHPAEAVAGDPRLLRGTETVLLVEDNDAVREMARETLEGYGYQVVEASNGREALRIAAPALDRISIVLTDVVMPLMGGAELAVRLRTMRPDLKFIFASGYASDPVPGPPASSPNAAFLQKPFTPSALGRLVRQVLDVPTEAAATL